MFHLLQAPRIEALLNRLVSMQGARKRSSMLECIDCLHRAVLAALTPIARHELMVLWATLVLEQCKVESKYEWVAALQDESYNRRVLGPQLCTALYCRSSVSDLRFLDHLTLSAHVFGIWLLW